MELRDALTQISEIREQMARAEVFRGYRSVTVGFSGLVAFVAAGLQPIVAPHPEGRVQPYLILWLSAAAISMLAVGIEMYVRGRRSALQARVTLLAVELFLPCLVAGTAVTWVMMRYADAALWMLPGLWAILFSLGAYASCRLLPRPLFWAACFYLVAGCLCLAFAQGEWAFSPWAMGLTFGCGQLLTAAILYWTLERPHGRECEQQA
jgi:hypothetical protein